jgi:hypothetical protein
MDRWQYGDYARYFFSSFVENSGCYGNKYAENRSNFTHKLDPVITQKVLEIFL